MIALKEVAWYRTLTLQTFRAFECVVPIMRDRVKNSPRPDRSRLPPRDSAFLLPSRWPSGEYACRASRLAHSKIVVCWHCVAVDWPEGVGYVGNVELAEFRLRVIYGACSALGVMEGCMLAVREQ